MERRHLTATGRPNGSFFADQARSLIDDCGPDNFPAHAAGNRDRLAKATVFALLHIGLEIRNLTNALTQKGQKP